MKTAKLKVLKKSDISAKKVSKQRLASDVNLSDLNCVRRRQRARKFVFSVQLRDQSNESKKLVVEDLSDTFKLRLHNEYIVRYLEYLGAQPSARNIALVQSHIPMEKMQFSVPHQSDVIRVSQRTLSTKTAKRNNLHPILKAEQSKEVAIPPNSPPKDTSDVLESLVKHQESEFEETLMKNATERANKRSYRPRHDSGKELIEFDLKNFLAANCVSKSLERDDAAFETAAAEQIMNDFKRLDGLQVWKSDVDPQISMLEQMSIPLRVSCEQIAESMNIFSHIFPLTSFPEYTPADLVTFQSLSQSDSTHRIACFLCHYVWATAITDYIDSHWEDAPLPYEPLPEVDMNQLQEEICKSWIDVQKGGKRVSNFALFHFPLMRDALFYCVIQTLSKAYPFHFNRAESRSTVNEIRTTLDEFLPSLPTENILNFTTDPVRAALHSPVSPRARIIFNDAERTKCAVETSPVGRRVKSNLRKAAMRMINTQKGGKYVVKI
eukprot:38418_1